MWGATIAQYIGQHGLTFQSTHPCGVRHYELRFWSSQQKFQSTHPCGVRLLNFNQTQAVSVSIHAPVWGATPTPNHFLLGAKFQSTHPCGVRRLLSLMTHTKPMFQSTHPCGVRRLMARLTKQNKSFNPRTRVGCDAFRHRLL